VGMPEDPLHVGQRHGRVAGHPVGRCMAKIMQPPAAGRPPSFRSRRGHRRTHGRGGRGRADATRDRRFTARASTGSAGRRTPAAAVSPLWGPV
jgi:hypothetical protein